MIPDDVTPVDDEVLAQLLAEDEALQAGMPFFGSSFIPPSVGVGDQTVAGTPPDLRECLRMLEKVWPRTPADRLVLPGPASPWKLGRFEVLQELGRGGFGIVYLAHDPKLGRRVALKVPRPEALLSDKLRRRFLHEARAAGLLDHPNIVPVFEAGEDGLLCYIASTYCEGPTLAAWSRRRSEPVPMRLAARLVVRMADAVQHAHDRGILHCDIKPSNVLLQQGADALDPADLNPRLTDFGLARLTAGAEPGQDLSRSGVPVGSPPYMAPEQAAGRNRDVGRGTDVYALGATLYELLTGRPPFRGETMTETLRMVIETEPVAPRTLRPGLSRDLETVCLKCLEKDPPRRYASASELAADLERFLAGTAVQARPIPAWERGLRWTRRRPAATTALVLAAVLVVGLVGVASWSNAVLRVYNEQLREVADREAASARLAERFVYVERLRLARQALELNQHERAQEILNDIHTARKNDDPREFSWRYLWRAARREVLLLGPQVRWGDHCAVSADGRTLVGYDLKGRLLFWDLVEERPRAFVEAPLGLRPRTCVSADGRLVTAVTGPVTPRGQALGGWVWDGRTGESRGAVHAGPGLWLDSITPLVGDRLLVAAGYEDGRTGMALRVVELVPGAPAAEERGGLADGVSLFAVSPDGSRVAVACDGRLRVHGTSAAELACEPGEAEGNGPSTHLEFSADGRIIFGLEGGRATFWDAECGRRIARFDLGENPAAVSLAADGRRIAVATARGEVAVWTSDGRLASQFRPDDREGLHEIRLAFSPDGRGLAVSSYLPRSNGGAAPISLRDPETGREIRTFPGRREPVRTFAFLPGGQELLIYGWNWPRVWRLGAAGGGPQPVSHDDEAWAAAYSPDGSVMATGSDDDDRKNLRFWDVSTGRLLKGWRAHEATISTLAFHPSGRWLATGALTRRENLRLWDVPTGRLTAIYLGHTDKVRTVAFSHDGRWLASGGNDRVVRLWDLATGQTRLTLLGHTDVVRKVAFSPDGRTLATAANDATVRFWDVSTGAFLRAFQGTEKIASVVYSVDGRTVAAADEDGVIYLWDAATGALRQVIRSDDAELRCLAVSGDGLSLAVAGTTPTIRFWDLTTGMELLSLSGHKAPVNAIAYGPDCCSFVSASHDGEIKLWRGDQAPLPGP